MEYQRIRVVESSIDLLVGGLEPADNSFERVSDDLDVEFLLEKLPPVEKEVANRLLQGFSFRQIGVDMGIGKSEIYKIKATLEQFMVNNDPMAFEVFKRKNQAGINALVNVVVSNVGALPLADFSYQFINAYDPEADVKGWRQVDFQSRLEKIWDQNRKSITMAPREHLKTTSVLHYLVKRLFRRKYPLEITYFHLTDEIAEEKLAKLKRYMTCNEIFAANFNLKDAKYWAKNTLELSDGTTITARGYNTGAVGKHPHIIILDDVIDRKVIYSDVRNKTSIDKFYSDIYPMISKDDPDRQIMIVGTAQRKDDLYHKLPADFAYNRFQAINEDGSLLCPEMYTMENLEKIKKDISIQHGERYWLKEYMNVPFESSGFIIKSEDVRYYDPADLEKVVEIKKAKNEKDEEIDVEVKLRDKLQVYDGWDLSVGKDIEKGDWTVGVKIGVYKDGEELRIYVLKIFRARIAFDARLRAVQVLYQDGRSLMIGIEEVAFQYDMIAKLKKETLLPIVGIKALTNKVQSFQAELAPQFEAHHVYVTKDMEDFVNELLSLPVGEYDDQADALKIAIKTALFYQDITPTIGFF